MSKKKGQGEILPSLDDNLTPTRLPEGFSVPVQPVSVLETITATATGPGGNTSVLSDSDSVD